MRKSDSNIADFYMKLQSLFEDGIRSANIDAVTQTRPDRFYNDPLVPLAFKSGGLYATSYSRQIQFAGFSPVSRRQCVWMDRGRNRVFFSAGCIDQCRT